MGVVQQYSAETILTMFNKLSEQNGQVVDMLQLLMIGADDSLNNQKLMLKGLQEINGKIDVILEKLSKLEIEFTELKNESRNLEEKLKLMTVKLSKIEDNIEAEELEDYYALSQSLYVNWEDLDQLTRRFIPMAEFLYSKLQKYDKPDYSPVILELCRAIENEFLLKIFKKYTQSLIKRQGRNLNHFLTTDRSTVELKDKTSHFVRAISKAEKTGNTEYTLGQMNTILSIMKDSAIVQMSPLLSDFEEYLQDNTEAHMLLDSEYIKKVNEIVSKYRNPSAHPEFMSIEKANKCREIMPDRLDYLMDCITA